MEGVDETSCERKVSDRLNSCLNVTHAILPGNIESFCSQAPSYVTCLKDLVDNCPDDLFLIDDFLWDSSDLLDLHCTQAAMDSDHGNLSDSDAKDGVLISEQKETLPSAHSVQPKNKQRENTTVMKKNPKMSIAKLSPFKMQTSTGRKKTTDSLQTTPITEGDNSNSKNFLKKNSQIGNSLTKSSRITISPLNDIVSMDSNPEHLVTLTKLLMIPTVESRLIQGNAPTNLANGPGPLNSSHLEVYLSTESDVTEDMLQPEYKSNLLDKEMTTSETRETDDTASTASSPNSSEQNLSMSVLTAESSSGETNEYFTKKDDNLNQTFFGSEDTEPNTAKGQTVAVTETTDLFTSEVNANVTEYDSELPEDYDYRQRSHGSKVIIAFGTKERLPEDQLSKPALVHQQMTTSEGDIYRKDDSAPDILLGSDHRRAPWGDDCSHPWEGLQWCTNIIMTTVLKQENECRGLQQYTTCLRELKAACQSFEPFATIDVPLQHVSRVLPIKCSHSPSMYKSP